MIAPEGDIRDNIDQTSFINLTEFTSINSCYQAVKYEPNSELILFAMIFYLNVFHESCQTEIIYKKERFNFIEEIGKPSELYLGHGITSAG